ncbi:hypothetical protein PIN31115_04473 [Pandoraea iniqua]|uniref:Internalin-A n=1 Tax=Pandoraea iniqua TaxID=2508288 RepID=A0A5E4YHR1_9BURK|nr:hypothetical protein [Pandoraea iniqua]VVE47583.1 hypothetical protein PIN31115_04473 [Pandoraea iniqua]
MLTWVSANPVQKPDACSDQRSVQFHHQNAPAHGLTPNFRITSLSPNTKPPRTTPAYQSARQPDLALFDTPHIASCPITTAPPVPPDLSAGGAPNTWPQVDAANLATLEPSFAPIRLKLTGVVTPKRLSHLPKSVRQLRMSECFGVNAKALKSLRERQLQLVDVSGLSLDAKCAQELAKYPALTALNLAGNRVGDAGAAALGESQSLQALNISGNGIGKLGGKALGRSQTLTTLIAQDNAIGGDLLADEALVAFGKNPSLKYLGLAKNGIECAYSLAQNQYIETLDLRDNSLLSLDLLDMLRMPALKHLHLSEFKARLPSSSVMQLVATNVDITFYVNPADHQA